jgi:cytidine deaminase
MCETLTNGFVRPQDRPTMNADIQKELLARARAVANHAYAPYSEFPVGAAALAVDGSIHTGCNVENASYGLTVCAERAAVSAAVSAGQRQIVAVAVSAPKISHTTPCGGCRQFLNEFKPANTDMAIVLDDREAGEVVWLDDLLPRAFGPKDLPAPPLATDTRPSTLWDKDDR